MEITNTNATYLLRFADINHLTREILTSPFTHHHPPQEANLNLNYHLPHLNKHVKKQKIIRITLITELRRMTLSRKLKYVTPRLQTPKKNSNYGLPHDLKVFEGKSLMVTIK